MAFSKAQSANFSSGPGRNPTLLTNVTVARETRVFDTVKAGAITVPTYDVGLPTVVVSGAQISTQSIGTAQGSTISWGENFKAAQWIIVRTWPLVDITGTGDTAVKQFSTGLPVIEGAVRGWSTGVFDHLMTGAGFDMTVNFGTTLGTIIVTDSNDEQRAHITAAKWSTPKHAGGPVPISVNFRISGPTDASGTYEEMDTSATPSAPEGTMTVSNSGGPVLSGINVINNSIQVSCNADKGGPREVYRKYTQSAAA